MIVWLDGVLVDSAEAAISPADRGLLLGDGLYETIRARNGAPQRLKAHLARLATGLGLLGFPPLSFEFEAAMRSVLAANALRDGSLRLTVTRGSGPRGLMPPPKPDPTVLIAAFPPATSASAVDLVIARSTRRNEASPLCRVKSLNCLDSILALREAQAHGADDAVLLNGAGKVAEATAANLFARIGGRFLTPPLEDGPLPGVMRAEILQRDAEEAPLKPEDLMEASEIFLTSSLAIRSVRSLDGAALRETATAERLRAELFD